MVLFLDSEENGQLFLNIASDSKAMEDNIKQKFHVFPSMLRPDTGSNSGAMKEIFPPELTLPLRDVVHGGPAYLLKSLLKEKKSEDTRPSLLGRRIATGIVRWGPNCLKIIGDFTYVPLYWEWTEDVIARCSARLKSANIYDAVYASLYQYDREPQIVRAFCESWCPSTNTLHTVAGEWSLSLWDLYEIGGLPVAGRRYDEAVPSLENMRDNRDKAKSIPRAFECLLGAYCSLASLPESKNVVRATQWVQYWCKCKSSYSKPGREPARRADSRPKSSHNPRGEMNHKPLEWAPGEMTVFDELGVDDSERKTVYLAAFLSCWLCVFVLPEAGDPVIRAGTFEVAVHMAKGSTFSLATPVLASIYHGLNKMVNADKPSSSGSAFPSHYLYGWLAHYFGSHHAMDDILPGPLMVRYSGSRSAKLFTDVEARNLIHDGSSFKASSLVLRGNRCGPVCDDKLDALKFNYIISLRTAYLPLRSKASFFLEPYHPTRFSRQFGFYQDIPGILPRDADDGFIPYATALKHFRLLLFKDSQTKLMLPGRSLNWGDMTTSSFKRWWAKVTVNDLRENIHLLMSSVKYGTKNKTAALDMLPETVDRAIKPRPASQKKAIDTDRPRKRAIDGSDGGEGANHKHRCVYEGQKAQVHQHLFGQGEDSDSAVEEVRRVVVPVPIGDATDETLVDNGGQSPIRSVQHSQQVSDASSSSGRLQGNKVPSAGAVTASPSSCQTVKMTDQLVRVLLQNLTEAPYAEVTDVAARVIHLLASLRNVGDDTSILQAAVDAYVKSVAKLFAVQQGVVSNSARHAREISTVEGSLRSARVTYKGALQTSRSLERQGEVVAQAIEEAKAKLRALHDEAESIRHQQSRHADVIAAAESNVGALQQRLDELKTFRASSDDLVKVKRELDQCKKAIQAVMH